MRARPPRCRLPSTPPGLETQDRVYAKEAIKGGLRSAFEVISQHNVDRILTLGGECSVSVAPFASLGERYGDDLAVIWIDSHPDLGTPTSESDGCHAMAPSMLLGHGAPDLDALLPAHIAPQRAAIAWVHSWTQEDIPHAEDWGVSVFSPDDLRSSTKALLAWLSATGCSKVAIHVDVDVVDSEEQVFGLGMEPGGLRSEEVRRVVVDISRAADVVGLTIAEYMPRQVLAMRRACVRNTADQSPLQHVYNDPASKSPRQSTAAKAQTNEDTSAVPASRPLKCQSVRCRVHGAIAHRN